MYEMCFFLLFLHGRILTKIVVSFNKILGEFMQQNTVINIKCKMSLCTIRVTKLQLIFAHFHLKQLLLCVEIIARHFEYIYPKFKKEVTLNMLNFVPLNLLIIRATKIQANVAHFYLQQLLFVYVEITDRKFNYSNFKNKVILNMLNFVFPNLLIIRAFKLQLNNAQFYSQQLSFCVEIIYTNFNYSKHNNEVNLNMLNFLILNLLMIRATKLQSKLAHLYSQQLLFYVEIIYLNFKCSKFKIEAYLKMVNYIFLNRNINLYENILSTYPQKIYKTLKFKHGVTLAMLKIDFSKGKSNLIENIINFISQIFNIYNFREMSFENYLLEMENVFDLESPGGDEDELARRMSSLGRAPEGAENPGEVGTGSAGVVGTVGSEFWPTEIAEATA